jgi:hypothetical protein
MIVRNLFAVDFITVVFFGLSCSLFPHRVFQLYGAASDDAAI